ncbi:MAG: hypothetical protein MUF42_09030 [Cytophagaceae bacterium]|jgi:hypothetical protein|nr:hypothetical protein [Cytophagaceae bacterium]
MKRLAKKLTILALLLDALLAIGFGLFSWIYPLHSFGSILAIPESDSSVFLSILSCLSLSYMLIGITCLIGIKATHPTQRWLSLLMILRHFLEGIIKLRDMGEEWLIGNPYPDIILHSIFILLYSLAIFYTHLDSRKQKERIHGH